MVGNQPVLSGLPIRADGGIRSGGGAIMPNVATKISTIFSKVGSVMTAASSTS